MNSTQCKGLVKNEILNVVEDFAHASSLHGVKYMFKRNSAIKDRLVWTVAVFICIIFAIGVGSYLWNRYRMVPTVIDVKDTHQPLYTFPFPTITVCSGTRIKRGPAREILTRYLPSDVPVKSKENILLYVMSLLSLLQFPNYNLMRPYLRTQESKQMLHEFAELNITDFMLQVMPSCEEVFYECWWHGSKFNCCDIFLLQRTEEGFCWSFNSLTAEGTSHCPLSEVLENEGVMEEDGVSPPECQLRRNTGISTGSGLELYLRPSDPLDNIGYRAQRVVNGVSILIHSSYEFPQAGTGVYAPNLKGSHMSLAIAAEITMSSDSIRTLAVEDRKCIFPDEERLHIHHVYTENSCLTECRMKYIMLMCRCKLYFFDLQELRVPDCGVLHLTCIAKNSGRNVVSKWFWHIYIKLMAGVTVHELMDFLNCGCLFTCYDSYLFPEKFRFYRPPAGTPGVTDRELMDSLNCGCRFTCYDSVYDLKLQRRIPEDPANQTTFAHVDMYYSKTGFVRYQRHIVFEFIDLVGTLTSLGSEKLEAQFSTVTSVSVSLGGVANLFLGFSLLSMVETIYWMYRIFVVALATQSINRKIIQVHPIDFAE